MFVFRVGEERRTLEAQLAKVTNTHTQTQIKSKTCSCVALQLMEERSVMAKSVEEQGLRMVHLEREGRQLEREVNFAILAMLIILIMEILTMVMLAMKLVILRMMGPLEREGRQLEGEVLNITILTETWILRDCEADDDVEQYHGDGDHNYLNWERIQLFILRGFQKKDFVKA